MKRLNRSDGAGQIPICPSGPEEKGMYGRGFQSILEGLDEEEFGEEDLCPQGAMAGGTVGEKKRRLRVEQVKALEKNFEVENKLEPERKVKLAQELGLQPRQVAVWFQNRRARWKTKQLERDYGLLKANYEALKLNYDSLNHDKEALLAEIKELRAKLVGEESYSSIKEEPMASESEDNNKAAEEEDPPALIFKDGSSDSDSSAILNGENSPHHLGISSSSPPIVSQPPQPNHHHHEQQHQQQQHQMMPLGFEYCSSSSSPFQGSDGRVKGAWYYQQQQQQQQLMRVEEHNFLTGEEPCSSFFSDDQAPSLAWYCSDQWN